jgi:hypothetical protein
LRPASSIIFIKFRAVNGLPAIPAEVVLTAASQLASLVYTAAGSGDNFRPPGA